MSRINSSGIIPDPTVAPVTANQGTPNTVANAWPMLVTDGTDTAEVEQAAGFFTGIPLTTKGLTTNARLQQLWPSAGPTGISGDDNYYAMVMANDGSSYVGIGSWITTGGAKRVVTGSGVINDQVVRVCLPTDQPAVPVSQSGTWTADTELPAAIALADSASNPTAPAVGGFTMGFNANTTSWDRATLTSLHDMNGTATIEYSAGVSLRALNSAGTSTPVAVLMNAAQSVSDYGFISWSAENEAHGIFATSTSGFYAAQAIDSEGSPMVVGNRFHDEADAGMPIKVGFQARDTNPTAVANSDRVNAIADKKGRQVVLLNHVRDLVTHQQTTISSSTTETTILAVGAAGVFHDLTCLVITNQTAAIPVTVTIKDATAGTTQMILDLGGVGADGSKVIVPVVPIKQTTAANNWTATLSVNTVVVDFFIQAVKNT